MDISILSDLLHFGERIHFEAKLAQNEVPKSLWETYSSFSNTLGGYIILGVSEAKESESASKRYNIVGVNNADKIITDFWNTIHSEKVNRNLLRDEDVKVFEYEGKNVICIHVPQAEYRDKPVFINGNPYKGTFKRTYEGDFHCTEKDVNDMIRDASDDGNDGVLIEHYDMNDIDAPTLQAYRNLFMQRNPDHVWNADSDKEFLRNMGGFTVDRTNNKECLTLAGLMMFGKGLSVRERFSNFRMDYLDKTNLLPGERWSDRLTYDGRWENNLFNFFRMVLPKLTLGTKRPFRMEGVERIDDTPVNKALREAFTNSIIHADLMTDAGVLKIEKTDEGYVFSNPGSLKLPMERIYEGGHSKARNPRMQNMLRLIGFGENIGSGFPSILKAWHEEAWRIPDLHEEDDLRIVELKLWNASLVSNETNAKLHLQYGTAFSSLSAYEQMTLATAMEENSVSNTRMQQLLKLNALEVAKILTRLVSSKMLLTNGKGRGTFYTINSSFILSNERKGNDSKENDRIKNDRKGSESKGNERKGDERIRNERKENERKENERKENDADTRRVRVLAAIRVNNRITTAKIAQFLGCAESTVNRDLSYLREHGNIVRMGGLKFGYWKILKEED